MRNIITSILLVFAISIGLSQSPLVLASQEQSGGANPNIVTNGEINGDTVGWTAVNATLSVSSGAMLITDGGSYTTAYQAITTVIGQDYKYNFDIVTRGGGNADEAGWGNTAPDGTFYITNKTQFTSTGTKEILFTATATTTYVMVGTQGSQNDSFDNFSVTKVLL